MKSDGDNIADRPVLINRMITGAIFACFSIQDQSRPLLSSTCLIGSRRLNKFIVFSDDFRDVVTSNT